jgi:hypothetical protein
VSKKADRPPAKPQVARKYAGNTRGKPFQAGNPGRPKGSKNASTLLMFSKLRACVRNPCSLVELHCDSRKTEFP